MMWFLTLALAAPTVEGMISYPPGASGEPTCAAYIFTAPLEKKKGFEPLRVMVRGCPPEFAQEVREAIRKWRWAEDEPQHLERWEVKFTETKPLAKVKFSEELGSFEEHVVGKHRSELTPTRAIAVAYPSGADGEPAVCKGSVLVRAETGRVESVEVTGCEEVFHPSAIRSLTQWEFEPVEVPQDWILTKIPVKYSLPVPPDPIELDGEKFTKLLTATDRDPPWFPKGGQKFSPATCDAIAFIEPDATVTEVAVTGCDELFHVALENAVKRWKWAFVGDPQPVKVKFQYVFDKKNKRKLSKRGKAD